MPLPQRGREASPTQVVTWVRKGNLQVVKYGIIASVLVVGLISLLSCGEDGVIRPEDKVEPPTLDNTALHAVDFPTNNGSAWNYINTDTGQEFTLRIEGIRDIGGITHRQMTVSEIRPRQQNSINRAPVDHISANSLYFRIDSDFFAYPLPIFATYFLKTPQACIESAFDAFIAFFDNPIVHEKHFPSRLIWDFPLQVGKEWVVFEKKTLPAERVIRRVVDANVPVTVPAGSYNAYVVEETIVGLSRATAVEMLFRIGLGFVADLNREIIFEELHQVFEKNGILLPEDATVSMVLRNGQWFIADGAGRTYIITREDDELEIYAFKQPGTLGESETVRYEPAKYWVAPNIGVVKYYYTRLRTATVNEYRVNLLRPITFELKKSELTDANFR